MSVRKGWKDEVSLLGLWLKPKKPPPRFTIKPIFAWYDLWVGAFWDQSKRRLYLFPLPMAGVVIQFRVPPIALATKEQGHD